MIDTHCHMYSSELAPDLESVMERAEKAGVVKFYLPAIDKSTARQMFAVEDRYPDRCFAMIGLHPCSVTADFKSELEFIKLNLHQRKFSAIGETGLDFYWDVSFKEQQYEALHEQAQLALQYGLPLVLHTRNAMDETIDAIKHYKGRGLKGIFHCFGGTLSQAREIINLGFLMGIGGIVTYKNSELPAVLMEVDLAHIVLETDAPYLPPVPYRGKRNESSYLVEVAKKIAAIKGLSLVEVVETTTANAERLFANVM